MEITKQKKFSPLFIASIIVIGLLHIVFAYLLISVIRYVNFSRIAIISFVIVAICLLAIIDILFYYFFRYCHLASKIVILSFSSILLLLSGIFSYYISVVNININKIVDNTSDVQYETIRVVVATYDDNAIKDIDDLNGKTIGSLNTTGISAASIGKQNLTDNDIKATFKEYNTTADLFTALVEDEVDAAIFSNTFETQLSTDDETYEEFFDKVSIVYQYEEKVQTNDDELSRKDLSSEPFTVLLIGYAPEAGGGGLTDTIILASVNPKTMSVTMTSIARDSYVPIACYGNNRSKINDAGAASNACLIDTVENLMGVNIDFYMKVNFQGVVDIVDALGGVYINSPIQFVGQSSSSTRGKYNVWVPKGEIVASGEQALAFARERHAMPGGDFDRQIHQQQVIESIAQKLIDNKDLNKALKVLQVAGDNFSTNMSVSQLTSVFNYIISAPNYSGQSQFQILDIKMSRLTGYTYWFYSYSMRLPLWSYYLYDGSIKENVTLSKETLGEFDVIKQWDKMNIFVNAPYIRMPIYTEYFNETHVPDNLPPIYPSLIGYTYEDAIAWANENGVSINWITIDEDSPEFNESQLGTVVAQDPRKGALIEEYPSCTLTHMGSLVPAQNRVPNFVGKSITDAIQWCNNNGIPYNAIEVDNTDEPKSKLVITQSVKPGKDKTKINLIEFTYYKKVVKQITAESLAALLGQNKDAVITFCTNNGITSYSFAIDSSASGTCGTITSVFPLSGTSDDAYVFYQAPHNYVEDPSQAVAPTCTGQGKKVYVCSTCGDVKKEPIDPTGHSWGDWSLYDASGTRTRECSVCHQTETETMDCPSGFDEASQTCIVTPDPTPNP